MNTDKTQLEKRKAKVKKIACTVWRSLSKLFTMLLGLVLIFNVGLTLTAIAGIITIASGIVNPATLHDSKSSIISVGITTIMFTSTFGVVWTAVFLRLSRWLWPNKYWFSKVKQCSCDCDCNRRIA